MSSGRMKPLETIVGVHMTSRSLSRTEMLPSLAAAKPLAYTRRPISQICSLSLNSFIMLRSSLLGRERHPASWAPPTAWLFEVQSVENAGAVGVHRLLLGVEGGGRLAALAEADAVAEAGA